MKTAAPRKKQSLVNRLLEPLGRCLTPEVARQLVQLRADPKTQARVQTLADKCNEGLLSPAERAEYEAFVSTSNFIAILQAKARALLARQGKS
jgi:hypothetical protein